MKKGIGCGIWCNAIFVSAWIAEHTLPCEQLLRGRVADVNTPFLCRSLHAKGWAVMRAVVLPDDVGAISTELRACSRVCVHWGEETVTRGIPPGGAIQAFPVFPLFFCLFLLSCAICSWVKKEWPKYGLS